MTFWNAGPKSVYRVIYSYTAHCVLNLVSTFFSNRPNFNMPPQNATPATPSRVRLPRVAKSKTEEESPVPVQTSPVKTSPKKAQALKKPIPLNILIAQKLPSKRRKIKIAKPATYEDESSYDIDHRNSSIKEAPLDHFNELSDFDIPLASDDAVKNRALLEEILSQEASHPSTSTTQSSTNNSSNPFSHHSSYFANPFSQVRSRESSNPDSTMENTAFDDFKNKYLNNDAHNRKPPPAPKEMGEETQNIFNAMDQSRFAAWAAGSFPDATYPRAIFAASSFGDPSSSTFRDPPFSPASSTGPLSASLPSSGSLSGGLLPEGFSGLVTPNGGSFDFGFGACESVSPFLQALFHPSTKTSEGQPPAVPATSTPKPPVPPFFGGAGVSVEQKAFLEQRISDATQIVHEEAKRLFEERKSLVEKIVAHATRGNQVTGEEARKAWAGLGRWEEEHWERPQKNHEGPATPQGIYSKEGEAATNAQGSTSKNQNRSEFVSGIKSNGVPYNMGSERNIISGQQETETLGMEKNGVITKTIITTTYPQQAKARIGVVTIDNEGNLGSPSISLDDVQPPSTPSRNIGKFTEAKKRVTKEAIDKNTPAKIGAGIFRTGSTPKSSTKATRIIWSPNGTQTGPFEVEPELGPTAPFPSDNTAIYPENDFDRIIRIRLFGKPYRPGDEEFLKDFEARDVKLTGPNADSENERLKLELEKLERWKLMETEEEELAKRESERRQSIEEEKMKDEAMASYIQRLQAESRFLKEYRAMTKRLAEESRQAKTVNKEGGDAAATREEAAEKRKREFLDLEGKKAEFEKAKEKAWEETRERYAEQRRHRDEASAIARKGKWKARQSMSEEQEAENGKISAESKTPTRGKDRAKAAAEKRVAERIPAEQEGIENERAEAEARKKQLEARQLVAEQPKAEGDNITEEAKQAREAQTPTRGRGRAKEIKRLAEATRLRKEEEAAAQQGRSRPRGTKQTPLNRETEYLESLRLEEEATEAAAKQSLHNQTLKRGAKTPPGRGKGITAEINNRIFASADQERRKVNLLWNNNVKAQTGRFGIISHTAQHQRNLRAAGLGNGSSSPLSSVNLSGTESPPLTQRHGLRSGDIGAGSLMNAGMDGDGLCGGTPVKNASHIPLEPNSKADQTPKSRKKRARVDSEEENKEEPPKSSKKNASVKKRARKEDKVETPKAKRALARQGTGARATTRKRASDYY